MQPASPVEVAKHGFPGNALQSPPRSLQPRRSARPPHDEALVVRSFGTGLSGKAQAQKPAPVASSSSAEISTLSQGSDTYLLAPAPAPQLTPFQKRPSSASASSLRPRSASTNSAAANLWSRPGSASRPAHHASAHSTPRVHPSNASLWQRPAPRDGAAAQQRPSSAAASVPQSGAPMPTAADAPSQPSPLAESWEERWAAAWATHAPFPAAESAESPEERLHVLQRERARLLRRHVARTEVVPDL